MGEPVSCIRRCFSEINDVYRALVKSIDHLKACETECIKNVQETADHSLQSQKAEVVVRILNSELGAIVERNVWFQEKLAQIKNLMKREIPYIPCGLQTQNFKYIGGNSPWCFWLQITKVVNIDLLHKTLLEKYLNNNLKRLSSLPDMSDYVCYVERGRVYRGKVLCLLEENRVKLRDVDTSYIKRVNTEQIYEIDSTTCNIPALAVNCSLSKNFEDETLWSKDLGEIFKNVLANGNVCLDIREQLNDAGVFLVNVYVIDEYKNFVDLHEWVIQRIIPELQDIRDKGLEPCADNLSPKALDAFFPVFNNPADMRESPSYEMLYQQSSVTVPGLSTISNVNESDNSQNYEDIMHDQNAVSSTQYISPCFSSGNNYHVNLKKPNTIFVPGEEMKVILSFAVSPWTFYVNFPNENNAHIDELKEDMTAYYSPCMDHAFTACPWFILKELFGKYCACCWNDYWYRVEVLDWNDAGKARVFLVDYGNEINVLLSALWPLFEQFTNYNMMAQRCHLAGVFPVYPENKSLPTTAEQRFFSLLDIDTERLCIIAVVPTCKNNASDSLGIIVCREDGSTVNSILLNEGYGCNQERRHSIE